MSLVVQSLQDLKCLRKCELSDSTYLRLTFSSEYQLNRLPHLHLSLPSQFGVLEVAFEEALEMVEKVDQY
ncbi:hypothetical protein PIB30_077696 [Stylosanthes scabra]|uniref:Uncharacterized protein n=1 Tax=Stylosanthes scabra TaxID=79078 RepID=A0ABU6WTT1_9FABA|nr:hypothetical protein [Stylosanthes scabra]